MYHLAVNMHADEHEAVASCMRVVVVTTDDRG